ncbi:PDZ domain-containing protein 9 [Crotalus adamanteus]|uniref:PDZ domain-containing protein 9 n=1 Tax=Crotalus adamanteus TaxID=8729 RepID=A0AAW1ATN8_CROAD
MEDSEHTLSKTIKTNIQMDEDGLGIILIQNGPYLQVSGVVDKGAAAKDGKLQAGDILLKIGHANVLGWTLRELRQLLHTVPIGTVLQIQVYRDFIKIPSRWQTALVNIPELKGPATDIESYASEENWTSSEDSENESEGKVEDSEEGSEESYQEPERARALSVGGVRSVHSFHGVHNVHSFHGVHNIRSFHGIHNVSSFHGVHNVRSFHGIRNVHSVHNVHSFHSVHNVHSLRNVKAVRSLSVEPLIHQPKWISKDWHIFERKTYTFTVGSDIGCDIMIHQDFETESEVDMSTLYVSSSSPYWTMPKHKAPPSASSSSSVSDAFWLENVSYELE